jgi:hypothetical protein
MWNKQQPSGIIEGWHGDGNFARTTIMYCLWMTQGTYLQPWRSDLEIGAEQKKVEMLVSGEDLRNGFQISVKGGVPVRLVVIPL